MTVGLQSLQFLRKGQNPMQQSAAQETGGAFDTVVNVGADYQAWTGSRQLASPQKGAMKTIDQALSYPKQVGETPLPGSAETVGTFAFKAGG